MKSGMLIFPQTQATGVRMLFKIPQYCLHVRFDIKCAAVTLDDKPLVRLKTAIRSFPFSGKARLEAGFLLRQLQKGQALETPHFRPMPAIGERCHELRIIDQAATRRMIYRINTDAIVIFDVFSKKTRTTPQSAINRSGKRLREYDDA
jgi:phage-related protein